MVGNGGLGLRSASAVDHRPRKVCSVSQFISDPCICRCWREKTQPESYSKALFACCDGRAFPLTINTICKTTSTRVNGTFGGSRVVFWLSLEVEVNTQLSAYSETHTCAYGVHFCMGSRHLQVEKLNPRSLTWYHGADGPSH